MQFKKFDYKLSFDEFIEYTWDYVSIFVVSDDVWDLNQDFIRELTYSLYRVYENSLKYDELGKVVSGLTNMKDWGKILEAIFSNINKFGNIKLPK